MDLQNLIHSVETWAHEREIFWKSNPGKQFKKTREEFNELSRALTSYESGTKASFDEVVDGIGDLTVTLVILARMLGVSLEYCLLHAFLEIRNRKGEMRRGIFVKETPATVPPAEDSSDANRPM